MKKTLMHINTPVAEFTCTKDGHFQELKEVFNELLLPDKTREHSLALRRWLLLRHRSSQIKEFSQARNFYGQTYFKSKNLRSMFDCYWVKEEDEANLSWDIINPHENWDPSFDSVFMLLYKPQDFECYDESSPNLTIPGTEPLMWCNIDGPGLINQDSQQDMEAYRASVREGLKFVAPRDYKIISGRVFSFKKVNVSKEIERIPFDAYYNETKDDSLSKIENIKNCCDIYGIEDWESFMQDVIKYSKINPQKTIELSDIGVLRNANTLECIGFDYL